MQKDSMDLMNVDYDDVLHLYRGWRKSESALKDKNKELNALKNRVAQLQESHDQFRSKINALESVKELTVSLQNQLTALQQENKQLVSENKELADLSVRAESLLLEKVNAEAKQAKVLKDVQLEFAMLKGRYEESIKTQHYLEKQAADEQALRVAAESRLGDADEHLATAKEEAQVLQNKLDHALLRLSQCDHELSHASEHLTSLSREVANINITKNQLSSSEAEAGVLRGDIARLIRLLEHAPETKEFLAHWKDSGGMDFIGMKKNHNDTMNDTDLNGTTHNDSILNTVELSPTEFNHLKRIHGGDPFPMSSNLTEENEYWVPTEAAKLGLQFLASKVPHAAPSVIMEFLRSMNKIWLKRERRRVKRVKTVMGKQIEDLKRQLANAKPYKHVMDERQIRRLKSQVKEVREKTLLTGRARKSLEELPYELQTFDEEDQNDESEIMDLPPHERRLCKMVKRASEHQTADVNLVSTEKLLQASLNSLESMGRRMQMTQSSGGGGGNANNISASLNMSHYHGDNGVGAAAAGSSDSHDGSYPNESYLRGALWLGRNMTMISEDLADAVDAYRNDYAKSVQEACHDTDPRRSCSRLALLANSGMTTAHSMMNKSRLQIRRILEQTSAIAPGDTHAFQALLQSLPIESALIDADGGKKAHSPHRHSHHHQTRSVSPGLTNRQSAILATSPMFRNLQSQSR